MVHFVTKCRRTRGLPTTYGTLTAATRSRAKMICNRAPDLSTTYTLIFETDSPDLADDMCEAYQAVEDADLGDDALVRVITFNDNAAVLVPYHDSTARATLLRAFQAAEVPVLRSIHDDGEFVRFDIVSEVD